MAKNREDAQFTEDTVALMIESFLTAMVFPLRRFTVVPFSRSEERILGADARIDAIKPFYMQFKRPSAYSDTSSSRIITDRRRVRPNPLSVSPRTLFFELRDKQPRHPDYQHNTLLMLRELLLLLNLGDAAYVCPLFLDRSAYVLNLHYSALRGWGPWRRFPWSFGRVVVEDPTGRVHFNDVPILADHISIPPHVRVSHSRHRYSFTERGTEICFHSPEALPEGGRTLADWMKALVPSDNQQMISREAALPKLHQLFATGKPGDEFPMPEQLRRIDDGIAAWLSWGQYLKENFSIEQYAFIRWRE